MLLSIPPCNFLLFVWLMLSQNESNGRTHELVIFRKYLYLLLRIFSYHFWKINYARPSLFFCIKKRLLHSHLFFWTITYVYLVECNSWMHAFIGDSDQKRSANPLVTPHTWALFILRTLKIHSFDMSVLCNAYIAISENLHWTPSFMPPSGFLRVQALRSSRARLTSSGSIQPLCGICSLST